MGAPAHAHDPSPEAWLLCPGTDADLARSRSAFAELGPVHVAAAADPGCERWATAFARAAGLEPEPLDAEVELAALLARVAGRALLFLPAAELVATVARALALAPHGARALRVDPGRAFLVRAERIGLVLRHANVLGPEREPGTRLPLWKSAP
jgi:hypothetical protein